MVGEADIAGDGANHAFLYSVGGTMLDLNALIDPAAGWTLVDARGINDNQQIAADGCKGAVCRALLLNPVDAVPELGQGPMLLGGLLVFLAARVRRAYLS